MIEKRSYLEITCDLVDALGPISHELHNIFNAMVLQVAIASQDVPNESKEKLAVIRSLVLQASDKLGKVDSVRRERTIQQEPVEINSIIQEVLAEEIDASISITTSLAQELPMVSTHAWNLSRLVRQILRSSCAALQQVEGERLLVITTNSEQNQVSIQIDDNGPGMDEERITDSHDPFRPIRDGENGFDRAASYQLAKQLGWKLKVANGPEGGIRVTISLDVNSTI